MPTDWPKAHEWWQEHSSWQVASVTVKNIDYDVTDSSVEDEEEDEVGEWAVGGGRGGWRVTILRQRPYGLTPDMMEVAARQLEAA